MNNKISSLSFSFILSNLLSSFLLGILFPFTINNIKTSYLLTLLISYIIGIFILLLFIKLFNKLPNKDIFNKIDTLYPKLKLLIKSILAFIIFIYLTIIIYRLCTFISSEFLTESPNYIVLFIIILPILYIFIYDYDVCIRISILTVIFSITLLTSNFISLIGNIDLDNIKPLLNNNILLLSKNSIIYIITYITPIFSLLIIPKNNIVDYNKFKITLFISYTITFIFMYLIYTSIIGVLGLNIASIYLYPEYTVLKTINVFNFLDNIENLNIILWLVMMIISSSFYLLFIKSYFKNILKSKSNKFINILLTIFIILFFILIMYLLPLENHINKINNLLLYILFFSSILLLIIIGLLSIKKTGDYSK